MAFNIFLQLFNVFQANSPPNTTLGVEPFILTTSSYKPAVPSFLRYPNTGREPPSTVVDCRGMFGCFPTDSPPWESPERPISLPPGPLTELGSFFCFYSARNPKCQKLNVEDYDGLSNLDISPSSYLVVITHGFLHSVDMPWVTSMIAALLGKYDDDLRVISLDWRKGSRPPYAQAVANIRLLGVVTGSMLNFLMENRGLKPANIHLVGHSLGAHLMGYAGSYLKFITNGFKVGRITGMDPAGPYFIGTPPEVHLDASDAFLVDIIHTDSTEIIPTVPVSLGLPDSSGHFDFYPNGGGEQNGCKGSLKKDVIGLIEYVSCSHDRAHLYFATTIAGNCTYIGVECTSWQEFKSGKCWDCNLHRCFQMGFEIRQIFPNDHSRNISNQLEKNISNFVLSEETKISIYLATTNSEHLCGEQLRFTIRMSTRDIAKNAGGEYGKFSLILRGKKEFAEIIPFKGSIQYIEPGINITWVEAVGEIGEIHSIVFRFQEEGGLFQRFFRPLATPSVYIQELTIVRLTQNERKYCIQIIMKLILSSICISSLVLANFSLLPQATAQCLTKNDDLSKATGSIDLSGVLEFNLRLFRELIPTDSKRNFIFSAYSIWNALTLAYLGSAGGQEQQLRTALGHKDKLSTLQKWRALEYFYKGRPQTNVNNTFITASKAFFDQKIEIRACMENIFSNEIEKLDFTQPQRAAKHINAFVSEITKGNIKELVSAAIVNHARLVLVNAAYFKGTWQTTFDKERTKPDTFTDFDGNRYTVDMMDLFGEFNYVFSDQLKATVLELPYAGPSISMLLFLPVNNSLENFNNLLAEMSTNNYEAVIAKLQASNKIKVKVNLPVFSLETQCGNELINALKSMGITDLFSPTKADFTAVTLDRSIFIDKSIHKAFIEVNEEGTTAGASTGLITSKIAGGFPSFECRRPFLFAILDNETKNLLFMGVYKTPESKLPTAPIPGKDKENVPNRTSNPSTGTSAGQNPNILSFTEDIGLSAPGRASNENSNQNVPFLGGEGGIVAPGRGLTLNPDHNIPETGDNGINFTASRGANLSPNSNIPGQGSNNQDQDPSNPVIRENRGRRDRNRRRGRVESEERD